MKNIFGLLILTFVIGKCLGQSTKQNNDDLNLKQENNAVFTFEDDEINKLPAGWNAPVGIWNIVSDNENKVLYQTAANSKGIFNIAVSEGAIYADLEMSVRIKSISGKVDQGGGLVWRYIDQNNYYIVRENSLEDNVVLYKVQDGKRTSLPPVGSEGAYGATVPKLGYDWNSLKVVVKDDLFIVYLNNNELYQVKDTTFTKPGLIGVWSKADASSYFDDLTIQQIK